MKKIKQETARKIGLFSSISLLIGSTIGVGIFFKNGNVFATNDSNSIAILISWIISGLISLCTAFCFAETGSSKQSHSGLGGWFEVLIGKRSGRFIKIIQPLFYFGIIAFSISIFTSESIFNIWEFADGVNFSVIMIIGFALFIFFILINYFFVNASEKFQVVASALKFIPLLMVILAGIIFGSINPESSLFYYPENNQMSTISFSSIIISIPSILFAFDSFVGVGNLSLDMKNPKRNVPLSIIIGMVIVTIFYLLVTISQIMVSKGDIYSMFALMLDPKSAGGKAMHIILSVFIFVSIIGVLNAFSLIVLRSSQSLVDEGNIIFHEYIRSFAYRGKGKNNEMKGGLIITIAFVSLLYILLIIPSSIINSDVFIDGLSNIPTTIFFSFYATIVLATLINRKTKRVQVMKIAGFIPMAIISILGCYLVSGFQLFYTFTTQTIINPHYELSWGLFSKNGFVVENWMATILFFSYILLVTSYYLITIKLTKRTKSQYFSFNKGGLWV